MKKYKIYRAIFLILVFVSFILLAGDGIRSKTFNVSKGGTIEVNTGVGKITTSTWDKNEVYVQVQGLDKDDLDKVNMEQEGNIVRVSFRSNWGMNFGHVQFNITIPPQFNLVLNTLGGDLDIGGSIKGSVKGKTSGGDIKIADVSGGQVEVSTSGGDIALQKLIGDGTLKTSGGDIRVGKIDGKLNAYTSGGDIEIESVSKSLEAKTAGGDIKVGRVSGEARIVTSGGDIEVGDVESDADISTSGGDINVSKVVGKATIKTSGGDILLKGAKGKIVAKTSGGDLSLKNINGSVEGKTSGGSIEAELIPSGKDKSRLSSAGGDVKLYIDENAKATIEATIKLNGFSWGKREYVVKSEFPKESYVTENDEIHAVYKLNGGGELIELVTSNSDIEIRKLRK